MSQLHDFAEKSLDDFVSLLFSEDASSQVFFSAVQLWQCWILSLML